MVGIINTARDALRWYILFASQDLRRGGPNPWNILALPVNKKSARATQPFEQNLVQSILVIRAHLLKQVIQADAGGGRVTSRHFRHRVSFYRRTLDTM